MKPLSRTEREIVQSVTSAELEAAADALLRFARVAQLRRFTPRDLTGAIDMLRSAAALVGDLEDRSPGTSEVVLKH